MGGPLFDEMCIELRPVNAQESGGRRPPLICPDGAGFVPLRARVLCDVDVVRAVLGGAHVALQVINKGCVDAGRGAHVHDLGQVL